MPRYLELLQNYRNFSSALQELVLNQTGVLYHEARYLLHEEISSPNICWSILQTLGNGTGRISEIGRQLGLPANQLTHYIELLKDLFLIYREVPVLEKNPARSKKGFYQVADPFLPSGSAASTPMTASLNSVKAKTAIRLLPGTSSSFPTDILLIPWILPPLK